MSTNYTSIGWDTLGWDTFGWDGEPYADIDVVPPASYTDIDISSGTVSWIDIDLTTPTPWS